MAIKVQSLLEKIFPPKPHRRIFLEEYVNYKGKRLFFDFYIKEHSVYIECQGAQHTKFVKHFHGTIENFRAQKFRDNLKIEYVQENNMSLVRVYDTEDITEELLLFKINKAMECGFYE